MSDPGRLDIGFGDLLTVITAGLAGLGTAMGWFRSSNKKRDANTTKLEERMNKYEEVRATQATQLAVLKNCQENIERTLTEIKNDIRETAEAGAHSVNTQLAEVLSRVEEVVAAGLRRSKNNQGGY